MKTKVVHCKKDNYDVYIGRPSEYGNQFIIGKDGNREEVIEKYRQWLYSQTDLIAKMKIELKDKILGCWCKPENKCHGDIIIEIIDSEFEY